MARSAIQRPFAPLAVVLAWLIPGAGHVYIGRRERGILIFLVIALTFWAGMAMGGALTVDSHYERWWFLAQVFAGAHGVSGWYIQDRAYQELIRGSDEIRTIRPTTAEVSPQRILTDELAAEEGIALVSPTDTVARAYTGVAGLLNLMCIFDVLMLSLLGAGREPSLAEVESQEPAL